MSAIGLLTIPAGADHWLTKLNVDAVTDTATKIRTKPHQTISRNGSLFTAASIAHIVSTDDHATCSRAPMPLASAVLAAPAGIVIDAKVPLSIYSVMTVSRSPVSV
jgi:hypothetical protein